MKKYKDEEWLQKKYIDERMSMTKIAEITDCSPRTIKYWLDKYGIETRNTGGKNPSRAKFNDRKWLKEKYLEEEMTTREIAEVADCSYKTVLRWLHYYEIEIWDGHHIDFTSREQKFLDGLMLGDGGMVSNSKSAYYVHSDTSKGYIDWLSQRLSQIGLDNKAKEGLNGYVVWTKCYRELKDQYDEWYPTGHRKTRVPSRVEVTPVTLFNWFIGDGTYPPRTNRGRQLLIVSTSFEEDYPRILRQIKSLGITCTKVQDGIRIWKESHEHFFDYILSSGIEIPPGYKHKFPDKKIIGGID